MWSMWSGLTSEFVVMITNKMALAIMVRKWREGRWVWQLQQRFALPQSLWTAWPVLAGSDAGQRATPQWCRHLKVPVHGCYGGLQALLLWKLRRNLQRLPRTSQKYLKPVWVENAGRHLGVETQLSSQMDGPISISSLRSMICMGIRYTCIT